MTNYNFTGNKISKELDSKTIQKGGLQTILMPVIKCNVGERKTEFGGYPSLIHYNKFREEQHNTDKFNKSMRKLRRNLRNKKLGQKGLTHKVIQTDLAGDSDS